MGIVHEERDAPHADIVSAFAARGPWVTRFRVGEQLLGGAYDASADQRLEVFFRHFPACDSLLELGCLEGGHTLQLAEKARKVVAIDSRQENLERARFIQSVHGVTNVEFVQADVESEDFDRLGRFDVIFNVGVLYHLAEPWRLLERLARMGRAMFLWTHVAPWSWRNVRRGGYRGSIYREGGVADPLSGMGAVSFWPTRRSLRKMLHRCGWRHVVSLEEDGRHPHGPAILWKCESRPLSLPRASA